MSLLPTVVAKGSKEEKAKFAHVTKITALYQLIGF
jgi:hypothetical protein